MKTSNEIKAAIIGSNLTNDQLNEIFQAIQFARSQLDKQTRNELRLNCQVTFKNRDGSVERGVVTKIARKTATVRVGIMSWRVPMSMLEVV